MFVPVLVLVYFVVVVNQKLVVEVVYLGQVVHVVEMVEQQEYLMEVVEVGIVRLVVVQQ